VEVLGEFVRLTYTRNSGVAFGLGAGFRFPYYLFSIVAAIVEADCANFVAQDSLHRAISARDSAAVWGWLCRFLSKPKESETDPLFAEIVAESARNDRIAAIFNRTNKEVLGYMLDAMAFLAPGEHLVERRSLLADLILTQSLGLMQKRMLRSTPDADLLAKTMLSLVERDIKEMLADSARQSRAAQDTEEAPAKRGSICFMF
ncbi:MAG: signal peptidase II, partial [Novosphingobium sp.]